jgi:hypothetical protein
MTTFQRPLVYPTPAAAIVISGTPDDYMPDEAYEYRFSVTGAIGKASATKLTGTLPPGGVLYYDNFTDEVVVKWPAKALSATPNQNLSFENNEAWTGPSQWAFDNTHATGGFRSAKFLGAGTADFVNNTVDIDGVAVVTASCKVQQGASQKNAVHAAIGVRYFLPSGPVDVLGNFIGNSSPSVQTSSVTATVPAIATGFALFVRGERFRENKPLWVDEVTSSFVTVVGTGSIDDIAFSFRVTDSSGRSADWSGLIAEGNAAGTFVEYLPISVSQHSVFSGTTAATLATIRDVNVAPCTGAVTNNVAGAWLQVDLGAAKEICTVVLGTGIIDDASLGGWFGRGGRIAYSSNLTDWTEVTDCYQAVSAPESPPADFSVHFAPATARYWRVLKTAGSSALRTSTFRLYGYAGGLVNATTTITQSSVFGGLTGTFANLGEVPNSLTTGAATGNTGTEWIKADLGSIKAVRRLVLAGGTLSGWGSAGTYLNGGTAYVQTSLDNITWTAAQPLVGVIADSAPAEHCCDITGVARYVRISRPGYLSTTAFRVYTLP